MILSVSEDVDVIASCLLNQGLIYFNDDEFQKSIDLMKRIIVDFPITSSVQQARLGLKKSYVILGEVKEYFDFLSENPSIDIDIASKDSIMFQVSLNFFEKKDYIKSREYFVEYLNEYSDGIFYLDATYFLAESNWNLNDSINAIKMYKSVIGFGKTEYLESSIIRLARFSYVKKDYENSNIYYQLLDTIGSNNYIQREAVVRLMYGYEDNLALSLQYAKRVLDIENRDSRVLAKAKLIIARSDLEYGNYARAHNLCDDIIELTANDDGSEAMYMKIYFKYIDEEYNQAEQLIFSMVEGFSSHYWIAKSFILLSDIYVKLDNKYQAKATLESVIENYDGSDLVNEARLKWEKIIENERELKTEKVIEINNYSDYEINYSDLEINLEYDQE